MTLGSQGIRCEPLRNFRIYSPADLVGRLVAGRDHLLVPVVLLGLPWDDLHLRWPHSLEEADIVRLISPKGCEPDAALVEAINRRSEEDRLLVVVFGCQPAAWPCWEQLCHQAGLRRFVVRPGTPESVRRAWRDLDFLTTRHTGKS